MLTKEFLLAGRATFTVTTSQEFRDAMQAKYPGKPQPRDRWTFKITHKAASGKWGETWFVAYLAGSDNEGDYKSFARLNPETGSVTLNRNCGLLETSWIVRIVGRVIKAIFEDRGAEIEAAGFRVMHAGKCAKCARTLTTPESLDRGFGEECWSKLKG